LFINIYEVFDHGIILVVGIHLEKNVFPAGFLDAKVPFGTKALVIRFRSANYPQRRILVTKSLEYTETAVVGSAVNHHNLEPIVQLIQNAPERLLDSIDHVVVTDDDRVSGVGHR
jgi:hypothetical protein